MEKFIYKISYFHFVVTTFSFNFLEIKWVINIFIKKIKKERKSGSRYIGRFVFNLIAKK